ncbi:MAG: hypothetical protein ACLRMZ_13775 [Blautia marasmi]
MFWNRVCLNFVLGSQPDEVSRRLTDEAVWEGCFEMAGEETEIPY